MQGAWKDPQVDPRVRGEARARNLAPLLAMGRSPRARGSPMICHNVCSVLGSIPACAGKPRHI